MYTISNFLYTLSSIFSYTKEAFMNKLFWRKKIANLLNEINKDGSSSFSIDDVLVETPPNQDLGDIAFPLFPFSRVLKMSPDKIGHALLEKLEKYNIIMNVCCVDKTNCVPVLFKRDDLFILRTSYFSIP